MSTAEAWDLHVYCDAPGCGHGSQYAGYTRAEALSQARSEGWTINLRTPAPKGSIAGGQLAHCPRHSGKRPNRKPLEPGQRLVTFDELRKRNTRSPEPSHD